MRVVLIERDVPFEKEDDVFAVEFFLATFLAAYSSSSRSTIFAPSLLLFCSFFASY